MAADAVDEVGRALDFRVPASCAGEVPLLGATGFAAAWNRRRSLATRYGVHVARVEHLLNRFGTEAETVLALGEADPSLRQALPGAEDYLRAEVVFATAEEGARHLDDVLARRTRISIETWDRGVAAAPHVAALMAPLLGWSARQQRREVDLYTRRVLAERASQEQPDDASADAARLAVPEVTGRG